MGYSKMKTIRKTVSKWLKDTAAYLDRGAPDEIASTVDGAELGSNALYEGDVYKFGDKPVKYLLSDDQIDKYIKSGILWINK